MVNIGRGRDGRAYACAVPPLTAAAEESAAEEEGDEVTTWMSVVDVIGKLRDRYAPLDDDDGVMVMMVMMLVGADA